MDEGGEIELVERVPSVVNRNRPTELVVQSTFTDPSPDTGELIGGEGSAVVGHSGLYGPLEHLYEQAVLRLSRDDERREVVAQSVVGWGKEIEPPLGICTGMATREGAALLEESIDVLPVADARGREDDIRDIGVARTLVLASWHQSEKARQDESVSEQSEGRSNHDTM